MRFFQGKTAPERLLWSRDIRFATRLAQATPGARVLELESGMIVIGPASELTDTRAASVAEQVHSPPYGLVDLDATLEEGERHIAAMAEAVQLSGLADRIGMSPSSQLVQMKTLDYFFSLRNVHQVAFQPIVELATGRLHEYECLFRPSMPMLPQSISAIVHAAIDTGRSVELDTFIVRLILARAGEIEAQRQAAGEASIRIAINFTPATLLAAPFEARAFKTMVEAAGLSPRQITLECTEEQAVPDVDQLKRQVKTLRRLGFGFAVDDAGAGYASFALIAALRPSIIKIDRLIAAGVARDDAKQALVEAFVSFGRRIGARLLAEGIERRADLSMLSSLGVELGQGYLIGRPAYVPQAPRPFAELRPDRAKEGAGRAGTVVSRRVRGVVPKRGQRPAGA